MMTFRFTANPWLAFPASRPTVLHDAWRRAALCARTLPVLVGLSVFITATMTGICRAQVTPLYSFTGAADGGSPVGPLIQASDGNLYGAAGSGFSASTQYGTVYKMDLKGNFNTFYTFTGGSALPDGGIIQATDGNFYGSSTEPDIGTLFKLDLDANYALLFSFGQGNYGQYPIGLIQATDGNLYGTCYQGGPNGYGTLYKSDLNGNLTLLHAFTGGVDGATPYASVMQASDGNLYGVCFGYYTTTGNNNYGSIYKVDQEGNVSTFYSFTQYHFNGTDNVNADGSQPNASLVQGADGCLYGVCSYAGAKGAGTIFKIDLNGNFTTVYSFSALTYGYYYTNSDGGYPTSALTPASDGSLYGTCTVGGTTGCGTLFRIDPAGHFHLLYTFTNGLDGREPLSPLLQASDRNLYGTCYYGGQYTTPTFPGLGTIYRFTLPTLVSLNPVSKKAYSPAFKLSLTGSLFTSDAMVYLGANALNTTFVSSTHLTALVPATLLTNAGTVLLTVTQASGTTNALPFTVLPEPRLTAKVGKPSRDGSNNILIPLIVTNSGSATAQNVQVTSAKLHSVATSATLPISLGNLAANASGTATLSFPGSIGKPHQAFVLAVTILYEGGHLTTSLNVKLP